MPNWCSNTLAVYGPAEDVKRFSQQAAGPSPWPGRGKPQAEVLNFHSVVPIPPEVLAAGYDPVGYGWELSNWGCKWGAVNTELVEQWEGHLKYVFDTAWSPPILFLTKLGLAWPTLIFLLEYEEMGMGFKGLCKVSGNAVEDHCVSL